MTLWQYLRDRNSGLDVHVFDRADDKLGRHQIHNPKARLHDARKGLFWNRMPTKPVQHRRYAPVFDQGETGMCTAVAALGLMCTGPFWTHPGTGGNLPLPPANPPAGQPRFRGQQSVVPYVIDDARQLYREETALDDKIIPGRYEPVDSGSTGDYSMAALRARGLIAAWQHTFRWNDLVRLLARQPVSIGVPWYSAMMEPDERGYLHIAGPVDGGHQVCVDELIPVFDRRGNVLDYDLGLTNSWSTSWGRDGRAFLSGATARQLLREGGDVVSPRL